MQCIECKKETDNPKFCSRSCAAKVNNKQFPKRGDGVKANCLICGKPVSRSDGTYCSRLCADQRFYLDNIKEWLDGTQDGLGVNGTVRPWVKRWLRETRGDACEICGWAEVNPFTGKRPLVADHIDGNWKNNRPENLKLICPNCDSLQATYKAANKGKGRPNRRRTDGNN